MGLGTVLTMEVNLPCPHGKSNGNLLSLLQVIVPIDANTHQPRTGPEGAGTPPPALRIIPT